MSDLLQVASEMMLVLSPYLVEAGKKAAGKAGEAGFAQAARLWAAVRGKLDCQGRGKELERLENDPSPERQAALKIALADFLADTPQALPELMALLQAAKAAQPTVTQTLHSVGDHNTIVQISGHGNKIG